MGLAAVCAGRRRPAREIATRELRSEWSISRPALALPPPTGTAARPCASKPARALRSLRRPPHQWGWVADVVWRVVLTPGQARPPPTGTAAAPSGVLHTGSNGGFALHEACWRRVAGVSDAHVVQFPPTRFTSSHGYRVWALSTRWPGCLKPPSPLLVCACGGLKPSSPLRVRSGRFWRVFRLQW